MGVNSNSVIPVKTGTPKGSPLGNPGAEVGCVHLGIADSRTQSDHHIWVAQRSPKTGFHTFAK